MKKRMKSHLGRKLEFIIGLSLSIFLVFSIFLVNVVISYNSQRNYTLEKVDIVSDTVYDNFSKTLINIDSASKSIFLNREFQNLSEKIYIEETYNETINQIYTIFETMNIYSDYSLIRDIGYIPRNINGELDVDNFLHYGYNSIMFNYVENNVNPNIESIIKKASDPVYKNGVMFTMESKYMDSIGEQIIFARNIYDIRENTYNNQLGIGFVCVNKMKLENILNFALAIDGLHMYASSSESLIITSNQIDDVSIYEDEKYITNEMSLSFYGWKLYQAYDTSYIFKSMSTYLITTVIISVSLIIIFVILYFMLHMRNLKSLFYMFDKFSSNANKKLSIIDYTEDKEVNMVIKAYNEMVIFNNKLNEDIILEKDKALNSQIEKNEFEIKSLYSQINKHFLINVLSVVHSLINLKSIEKANYCLENLSDFLRYSLNLETKADLKSEISSIISYFNVQNIRYPNVEYTINYDESLDSIIVPKLIIQPLIENAYVHGLKKKAGKIDVICKKENNSIVVNVIDNGEKIKDEDLEKINKKIKLCEEKVNTDKSDTHGIALVNIQRRLNLMYGNNASVTISTFENKTISSIVIKMEN